MFMSSISFLLFLFFFVLIRVSDVERYGNAFHTDIGEVTLFPFFSLLSISIVTFPFPFALTIHDTLFCSFPPPSPPPTLFISPLTSHQLLGQLMLLALPSNYPFLANEKYVEKEEPEDSDDSESEEDSEEENEEEEEVDVRESLPFSMFLFPFLPFFPVIHAQTPLRYTPPPEIGDLLLKVGEVALSEIEASRVRLLFPIDNLLDLLFAHFFVPS